MSTIREYLEKIKTAVHGKDVRQAINDAIRQCYDDGRAGAIDLQAREDISGLDEKKADKTVLAQEKTERQAEIAVERARINQFVSLQEGSTTGDAELIDARVDKNGNAHDNVGEHIREVTSQLSEEIDELYESFTSYAEQFIEPTKSEDGYIWTSWGGNLKKEVNNGGFTAYDKILLKPNETYTFKSVFGYYSHLFTTDDLFIEKLGSDASAPNIDVTITTTEYCYAYITGQLSHKGKNTMVYNGSVPPSDFICGFYDKSIKSDVKIPNLVKTQEDVENLSKVFNVDFGFIEKFAVIGDSYASGEIYVPDSTNSAGYKKKDYYNISWGQIMARKYGNTCVNLSKGGLTTRSWLTSDKGLELMNSSEPQQLYMCMLGHNDEGQLGIDYLGSIDDIKTDYTQNNDTFYGNYGKIICKIKEKSPKAKIILMTVAYEWGTLEDSYNEAIKNIANHFSIPYIDIKTDKFYTKTGLYQTGKKWNHPTASLYGGMATANVRLFNKCVEDNYQYFADYTGELS